MLRHSREGGNPDGAVGQRSRLWC